MTDRRGQSALGETKPFHEAPADITVFPVALEHADFDQVERVPDPRADWPSR